MVKRLSLILALVFAFMCTAQAQVTPMPLDPNIRHGVLPNGMNYYLLHNEKPKDRANFYIAQKVGSTLETPDQLGLAHFLEHMAFNGSKNFPGKLMLNYLQSKGIRFGADINAYTSFDETVYNINNVPTTDQALMDSVLLVLHDWSCDLSLEDAEIDAERGVIQEEWRSRNNAGTRMWTAILPQIYSEYQYTRMPIGTMEVVMNFPYQALRDYYEKWYRPDQQGIVIVGDFDVDAMEAKVKEMFTPIEMPANAAPRLYPQVSKNVEPIYVTFEDPEFGMQQIMFSIKYDGIPLEMRNSMDYYSMDLLLNLVSSMVNTRLAEMAQKADCPFAQASLSFGQFYVSKTQDAIDITVIPKTDAEAAFRAALEEVVRSFKTGFSESEFTRAKDNLKSNIEKQYNERDKTTSDGLATAIISNFTDYEPYPGIEKEWEMAQQILSPMLPVVAVNQVVSQMLDKENQVLVVLSPKKEEVKVPTKEAMLSIVNDAFDKEYEAYVDEVITEPLIANMPKAGKIVKEEKVPGFDATLYTLSNGVKVYVKDTDFKSDEIVFNSQAPLGKKLFEGGEVANMMMIENAVECSKLGNFDNIKMGKYLTGKNVSCSFSMGTNTCGISGNSSVKDLETAMQILYMYYTGINPDEDTYKTQVENLKVYLANMDKNPQVVFTKHLQGGWYNDNPYAQRYPTKEILEAADYNKMLDIYKQRVSNAADYTFFFVGNIDNEVLKPLLEQYVASLPSNPKALTPSKTDYNVYTRKGQFVDEFNQEMQSPQVMVFNGYTDNGMEVNLRNELLLQFTADILDNIFTNTLREEEGGTYSPQCGSTISQYTKDWTLYYVFYTGDDSKEKLSKRAYEEMLKLFAEGANEEDFNKVKGAELNQTEIYLKNNIYWINALSTYNVFGSDDIVKRKATIESITLDELNKFMKNLYDGKNRIQVILNGVAPAEK